VEIFYGTLISNRYFQGNLFYCMYFYSELHFLETISRKYGSLLVPLAKTVINKVSAEIFPLGTLFLRVIS
jgi:hypothetical protein